LLDGPAELIDVRSHLLDAALVLLHVTGEVLAPAQGERELRLAGPGPRQALLQPLHALHDPAHRIRDSRLYFIEASPCVFLPTKGNLELLQTRGVRLVLLGVLCERGKLSPNVRISRVETRQGGANFRPLI
jgi:hypothetical protein